MHILVLILLLFTGLIDAMEKAKETSVPWPYLQSLPEELHQKVMHSFFTGKTIEEVAKNIRALSWSNQKYHAWLNDEMVTIDLIRLLSKHFGKDTIAAAVALKTDGAGMWLARARYRYEFPDGFYADLVNPNIGTYLNDAVYKKDLGTVKFVLDHVPKVLGKDVGLLGATLSNDPAVVKVLLDKKANPNTQGSSKNRTVLMWATLHENVEIVRMLLQAKADRTIVDCEGHTALWYAEQLAHSPKKQQIIELLTFEQ